MKNVQSGRLVPLSIDSRFFEDFKRQFDAVLTQTCEDMITKDVDEGQITAKFSIVLQPTRDSLGEPATSPIIKFTVGNQIVTKMSVDGAIHCGEGSVMTAGKDHFYINCPQMSFDDLQDTDED